MTKKGRSKPTAPKNCGDSANRGEVSGKVRIQELLERTIEQFETKIMNAEYEPTVAEYVKLLQLGLELEQEDEPKEIKVTWVGPNKKSQNEK